MPAMCTRFWRARSPLTIDTVRFGTPSADAITSINSAFAAPSTGGAVRRTSKAPPRVPATPDFPARGITRTLCLFGGSHPQHVEDPGRVLPQIGRLEFEFVEATVTESVDVLVDLAQQFPPVRGVASTGVVDE